MTKLKEEIHNCRLCKEFLPLSPRPIVDFSEKSKIIIIGQAPGRKAYDSETPWNDQSGDNLRRWLGVSQEEFYNTDNFALVPMGFCFPGSSRTGDLPPRKECAPTWHNSIFDILTEKKLIILVGHYAVNYYLKQKAKKSLTETVRHFNEYLPKYFPLVHPSPRNRIWHKKNDWFEYEVLPELQLSVLEILKM